ILAVRQAAIDQLVRSLDEAKARRTAGDATITDVAQADAQLEPAHADFATAQQQLQPDRSNYATLVAQNPGKLEPEPPLPNLPLTVDEAFDRAESMSPDLKQAQ